MTTGRTRRGGFSLIELLVVIAIIATLSAIAVGTFVTLRTSGVDQAAEKGLETIHTALANRWQATVSGAGRDVDQNKVHPEVMTFCHNDKALAKVVWAYLKLKNEFPTTKLEATTGIKLTTGGATVLPAKTVFTEAYKNLTGTQTDAEDSAALIYLALRQTGTGGVTMEADGTEQLNGQTSLGMRCFIDQWGHPMAFVRMAYPAEVDAPPYVPSGSVKDPLDPRDLLKTKLSTTELGNFWTTVRGNHIAVGTGASIPATYSNSRNWVSTLVSAGPDEQIGNLIDTGVAADNLLSFRLRAGQKAN